MANWQIGKISYQWNTLRKKEQYGTFLPVTARDSFLFRMEGKILFLYSYAVFLW